MLTPSLIITTGGDCKVLSREGSGRYFFSRPQTNYTFSAVILEVVKILPGPFLRASPSVVVEISTLWVRDVIR